MFCFRAQIVSLAVGLGDLGFSQSLNIPPQGLDHRVNYCNPFFGLIGLRYSIDDLIFLVLGEAEAEIACFPRPKEEGEMVSECLT